MIDQLLQTMAAAMIAVLIVGVFAGCTATQPDMSRQEAINITSLASALGKPHEKESPKTKTAP